MRTLDLDYGGYKHVRQPFLKIRNNNRTKFSNSVSNDAAKSNPSQSNFSAEISEWAGGWKQLDDLKCFLCYSALAKHGAPFILPKEVSSSPQSHWNHPKLRGLCLCISHLNLIFAPSIYSFLFVPCSVIITSTGKEIQIFKIQLSCCCSASELSRRE